MISLLFILPRAYTIRVERQGSKQMDNQKEIQARQAEAQIKLGYLESSVRIMRHMLVRNVSDRREHLKAYESSQMKFTAEMQLAQAEHILAMFDMTFPEFAK